MDWVAILSTDFLPYDQMEATFSQLGSLCTEHIRSGKMGTLDTFREYKYNLNWKPVFDGMVLGVLHILSQDNWGISYQGRGCYVV